MLVLAPSRVRPYLRLGFDDDHQPAVIAFFNFELIYEHRLVGWQSG